MRLRRLPARRYAQLAEGERGPYLPVLLEACGENQLAYEYRHGVTSYGAFTYALTQTLRNNPGFSFVDLVTATNDLLKEFRYDQIAQIIGPETIVGAAVPGGATPGPP